MSHPEAMNHGGIRRRPGKARGGRGVLSREHGGTFRVGRPVQLPWGLHPVCSVGSGAAGP